MRTVINVKIEEICSARFCAFGRRRHSSVSRCLFSEPSEKPAGVRARSVSASEIEVNWQALSFIPERVLGYEVHFTLLNGNRNHTHILTSNTIQMLTINPCCTSKPSLPNSASPWKWLFHLADCYCQKLYSSLWQHDRKTCQSVFKRTKENCLATCLFMLLSFVGYHDSNIGPCVTALGNATLEMHGAQHSRVWCVFTFL